MSRDEAIGRN